MEALGNGESPQWRLIQGERSKKTEFPAAYVLYESSINGGSKRAVQEPDFPLCRDVRDGGRPPPSGLMTDGMLTFRCCCVYTHHLLDW